MEETKAISTLACSLLQVPVLGQTGGGSRGRLGMRMEGGDEGVQALCCAVTWLGAEIRRWLPRAVRNVAQQLLQELAASQLWPQELARQGWTRAWPVACRSHGCYSGSVAAPGSYGDRVEVMCPDHIIGVD